jgi:Septum formation
MNVLTSKPLLIALGVVAGVVVLVVLLATGGDDETAPQTSGAVAAHDLRVGTCITDATSTKGDVRTFDAVECDTPHDGEVYTIFPVKGAKRYPGVTDILAAGQRGCRARLRRQATAKAFRDRRLGFKFVYPTKQSWAQGDHDVTCVATYTKPRSAKLAQR